MPGGVIVSDDAFDASIDALIARINEATVAAMSEAGMIVVRATRLQFDGQHPPGAPRTHEGNRPQNATENLSNSIAMQQPPVMVGPGVWRAEVAPSMIYGRRVELGFLGLDSLNRNYTPHELPDGSMSVGGRPYPFMAPGLEKSKEAIGATFRGRWAIALGTL